MGRGAHTSPLLLYRRGDGPSRREVAFAVLEPTRTKGEREGADGLGRKVIPGEPAWGTPALEGPGGQVAWSGYRVSWWFVGPGTTQKCWHEEGPRRGRVST